MEMTKTNLKNFRNDFVTSVKNLEERYGVSINLGNISYDDTKFTAKIEVKNPLSEAEEFASKARILTQWGIKPDMYRKIFKAEDGKEYMLVDLDTKARKNVCIIEKVPSDGKRYKCEETFLGIKYDFSGFKITQTDIHGNVINTTTL